jgi:hypothetical protein
VANGAAGQALAGLFAGRNPAAEFAAEDVNVAHGGATRGSPIRVSLASRRMS